ncbi:MAG: LptF/LptG family permease, partial [Ghiorsea sp.]|nr:LptF/LptG family permease [Ghiorsea sp.]
MTVLFRWIFVSSLMRIVAIALGIILLFMVAESFGKAALIGKTMTVSLLFEYLMLKIPFMVADFLPVIVLLGAAIYMTEISHHHELVALRSAGISMRYILTPLLAVAACVGFFTFAMSEWVEPSTNIRLDEMERTLVEGKKPVQLHGEQWLKDGQRFFRIQPLQGKYFSFMMLETDEQGQWQGRTDASKAYYAQGAWHLEKVFVSRPDASKGMKMQTLENLSIQTIISPATAEPPKPRDMQLLELYRFTESLADAGLDASDYEYQLHKKVAAPLACLIMVILAYSLCGNMGSRIAANSKGLLAALTL